MGRSAAYEGANSFVSWKDAEENNWKMRVEHGAEFAAAHAVC